MTKLKGSDREELSHLYNDAKKYENTGHSGQHKVTLEQVQGFVDRENELYTMSKRKTKDH